MPRLALFFALSLLALTPFASADIPRLISLQGRLTDASDNPISSSSNFAFRIYDVPTGGSPLWTEFQTLSPNSLGIFSALLGSVTRLNIPFNTSYWLEVQVNSEILSPRQRMGSAGYALRSENPWNATGNNIYTTNVGNVGIGLANPLGKLHVSGGDAIFGGNVGIGTTGPVTKLEVKGGDITFGSATPVTLSVVGGINPSCPAGGMEIGKYWSSVTCGGAPNSVCSNGCTTPTTWSLTAPSCTYTVGPFPDCTNCCGAPNVCSATQYTKALCLR